MKNVFLSLLFVLLTNFSNAQSIFTTEGAEWFSRYNWGCSDPNSWGQNCEYFTIMGDTSFNVIPYKKLYRRIHYNDTLRTYIGAFRTSDEGKKVYFRHAEDDLDFLLYDFSLEVGDTLTSTSKIFHQSLKITEIGETNFRKFFRFQVLNAHSYLNADLDSYYIFTDNNQIFPSGIDVIHAYIDGIGGEYGLFPSLETNIKTCFEFRELARVTVQDSLIWGYEFNGYGECMNYAVNQENIITSDIELFPNPFTDSFTIDHLPDAENSEIEIYTLSGKMIYKEKSYDNKLSINTEDWQAGVYLVKITNDREVLMRKVVKY